MRSVALILGVAAALAAAGPTWAQQRLPAKSRAEQQVEDLNAAIARQQSLTRERQQTQFEINQLRGDIQRSQQFPSMTGPGAGSGCPPGSIGC
jgi:TolA-binding protein